MVNLLQDQILDLQNQKDLVRRQRNQERAIRFMNAKARTIGMDKDFLDQQIQEKELKRKQQEEDKIKFNENQKELCQYLHERDHETTCTRIKEAYDVKETLLQQMLQPKNNAIANGTPLNVDECTVASLQKFVGEDLDYCNRRKMQQQQFKRWCTETMDERATNKQVEDLLEYEYAQHLLHQDILNMLHAQREEQLHRDLLISIQQENIKLNQDKILDKSNVSSENVSIPLISECTDGGTLYHYTQKIRPDHFKGFSKEALEQIIQENDDVVKKKQVNQWMEKLQADEWSLYQKDLYRKQEINAIMQQENRIKERRDIASFLEQQKIQQKMGNNFDRANRFGKIDSTFFESFGTSCR